MSIRRIVSGPRLSKAVVVNGMVFISGLTALEKGGGVAAETVDVLAQVEGYLTEAGTGKGKLVRVTVWLADMADFEVMDAVWQRWIVPGQAPARATVQAGLRLEARVEMMAEALL